MFLVEERPACAQGFSFQALAGNSVSAEPVLETPATRWKVHTSPASHVSTCDGRKARPGDRRPLVVLDGFVTNLPELESASPGGRFSESSRPATRVANLFAHHGSDCLDKLKGHFALCLIDPWSDRVIVQRDRLGGRSSSIYAGSQATLIASRPHLIARHPAYSFAENQSAAAHLFAAGGVPEPGISPLSDVRELLPGERRTRVNSIWSSQRRPLRPSGAFRGLNERQVVHAFLEAFRQAVDRQIAGHDSITLMLSGGLDSTPAAAISRMLTRTSGTAIRAVSWSVPELESADETRWIRESAEFLDLPLTMFSAQDHLPFSNLDASSINPGSMRYKPFQALINACLDQTSEARATLIVNSTAGDLLYPRRSEQLVALLRGRHGSAFARRLASELLADPFRWPLNKPPIRQLARHLAGRDRKSAASRGIDPSATDHTRQIYRQVEYFPPEQQAFISPVYAQQLAGAPMSHGRSIDSYFADIRGITWCDPFHDEDLVDLVQSLPATLHFGRGATKWFMREAMRGQIPEAVRTKRRTGILTDLALLGYARNRHDIRCLLMERQTGWSRYIRHAAVEEILGREMPSKYELGLIVRCIGHALFHLYARP